eukprot:1176313-Prorocentrum_minimum.AAC.3
MLRKTHERDVRETVAARGNRARNRYIHFWRVRLAHDPGIFSLDARDWFATQVYSLSTAHRIACVSDRLNMSPVAPDHLPTSVIIK